MRPKFSTRGVRKTKVYDLYRLRLIMKVFSVLIIVFISSFCNCFSLSLYFDSPRYKSEKQENIIPFGYVKSGHWSDLRELNFLFAFRSGMFHYEAMSRSSENESNLNRLTLHEMEIKHLDMELLNEPIEILKTPQLVFSSGHTLDLSALRDFKITPMWRWLDNKSLTPKKIQVAAHEYSSKFFVRIQSVNNVEYIYSYYLRPTVYQYSIPISAEQLPENLKWKYIPFKKVNPKAVYLLSTNEIYVYRLQKNDMEITLPLFYDITNMELTRNLHFHEKWRSLLYPFAMVLDIITFPIQLGIVLYKELP